MVDDVPDRKRDLRDRMPLRSRENHPPSKGTPRHIRDRTEHDRPVSRELRDRPEREIGERSDREKNSREIKERDIKVKNEVREKSDARNPNEEKDVR